MQRMHLKKKLITTIKKLKLEYLGHITREVRYSILQLIMQEKTQE